MSCLRVLLLCSLLWAPAGYAETLIIQSSDQHSQYTHMDNWLKSLQKLKEDFLKKYPGGNVILVVNGDFAGASSLSLRDKGQAGIDILSEVSKEMPTIFVFGNHDAFDFSPEQGGAKLFEKQMLDLNKAGVYLLAGNAKPDKALAGIIKPYVDVPLANGKVYRFAGFTLDQFTTKSGFDPATEEGAIREFLRTPKTLLRSYEDAVKSGVAEYIPIFHQGFSKSKEFLQAMEKREQVLRKSGIVRPFPGRPIAFAAHDHQIHSENVGKTRLIDSGSFFDLSEVVLSDKGEVESYEFLSHETQEKLVANLVPEGRFAQMHRMLEEHLAPLKKYMNEVIAISKEGFRAGKMELKAGPHPDGSRLANAHREWLRDEMQNAHLYKPGENASRVVAIYNSSSYRNDDPIPPGPVTRGQIINGYPLPGKSKGYRMTGKDLETFIKKYRDFRMQGEGVFSPHISDNLRLNRQGNLQILNERNNWVKVQPEEEYLVALDKWSAINGYRIRGLDKILARSDLLAEKELVDINLNYLPKQFGEPVRPADCQSDFKVLTSAGRSK